MRMLLLQIVIFALLALFSGTKHEEYSFIASCLMANDDNTESTLYCHANDLDKALCTGMLADAAIQIQDVSSEKETRIGKGCTDHARQIMLDLFLEEENSPKKSKDLKTTIHFSKLDFSQAQKISNFLRKILEGRVAVIGGSCTASRRS